MGRGNILVCDSVILQRQRAPYAFTVVESEWTVYETLDIKGFLSACFVTEHNHIVYGIDNYAKIVSYMHQPNLVPHYRRMQPYATSIKSQTRYNIVRMLQESRANSSQFMAHVTKDIVRVDFNEVNTKDKTNSAVIFRCDQVNQNLLDYVQLDNLKHIAVLTEYYVTIFDQFT